MRTTTASRPGSAFDQFLAEELEDFEVRQAYEDAQSRHRVIDLLIHLRNMLGRTQTQVARSMGVKQPAVSGFETEGSDPRLSTLQRYARAVDATLWVTVQPNLPTANRPDFYFDGLETLSTRAEHSDVTDRVVVWADARPRYLRSLPLAS